MSSAAEALGEVLLERRREREHVGAEVDLEAEVVGVLPERAERLLHREGPGDVVVALVVDAELVEGQVLDEARDRDGGRALGEHVVHVLLEVDAADARAASSTYGASGRMTSSNAFELCE